VERPDDADLALVGAAVSALRRGLGPARHPTATAARGDDGSITVALGLKDIACAETGAVSAVLATGRRVTTLATVKHLSEDATRVLAPCPSCRAMLQQHAPAARVVHLAEGLRVSRVDALP
jgi:cytidine deaminase